MAHEAEQDQIKDLTEIREHAVRLGEVLDLVFGLGLSLIPSYHVG